MIIQKLVSHQVVSFSATHATCAPSCHRLEFIAIERPIKGIQSKHISLIVGQPASQSGCLQETTVPAHLCLDPVRLAGRSVATAHLCGFSSCCHLAANARRWLRILVLHNMDLCRKYWYTQPVNEYVRMSERLLPNWRLLDGRVYQFTIWPARSWPSQPVSLNWRLHGELDEINNINQRGINHENTLRQTGSEPSRLIESRLVVSLLYTTS